MEAAPKLLLDTNILVDLAQGKLSEYEGRLEAVANAGADLIWLPEIVVQELVAPMIRADDRLMGDLIGALTWADRLAGNRLAEGYDYALRMGAASRPADRNAEVRIEINKARRKLIKMRRRSDLSPDLIEIVTFLRDVTERQRSQWATHWSRRAVDLRRAAGAAVRELVAHEMAAFVVNIASEAVEGAAGRHSAEHGRELPRDDIKSNLREFFYFDAALIVKGFGVNGYNFEKNRTDFHDWLLCAYPASGYLVVTGDKRLRDALEMVGCPSPRVHGLEAGLRIVETWLASS
jgi:hypothetical protein